MTYKILLLILTIAFLTACSFDKMYLQPTKVPADAKGITLKSLTDTTIVLFNADTYQPTFLKNGKDTIAFDFTIESVVFESSLNTFRENICKLGWFL